MSEKHSFPIRTWAYRLARGVFSARTLASIRFDLKRLRARGKRVFARDLLPSSPRLHLGCGMLRLPGWLNVDVTGSDFDVDLGGGRLPWRSGVFDTVLSEHLIEHLDLMPELIPLLREVHRVMAPGGELWLSCPDIETVCRAYLDGRVSELLAARLRRWPGYVLGRAPLRLEARMPLYPKELLGHIPPSHFINDVFHQWGEHKNLFDFDLLVWALGVTGFENVARVDKAAFVARFPGVPKHADDDHGVAVRATVAK
ncbi:MAG: methyltransferase domain-containing protein [Anaerolineae bacterium]|nr:methyltransferase domain-containing protein [Anaerolineae bacterium]